MFGSIGVSATSLIRQFDPMTPIISMTSNSNPQEILTYFSHGMNDILPKPFTKEGLLGMLEVSFAFSSGVQRDLMHWPETSDTPQANAATDRNPSCARRARRCDPDRSRLDFCGSVGKQSFLGLRFSGCRLRQHACDTCQQQRRSKWIGQQRRSRDPASVGCAFEEEPCV